MYNRLSDRYNTSNTEIFISNMYRFSNKLSISLTNYLEIHNRNYGFAALRDNGDSVIMSLRKIRTAENVLNTKYSFSNKLWLTLRIRHYWSKVDYYSYKYLLPDGHAQDIPDLAQEPDINLNLFNVDMNFTWQFGPGSFINFTWKTASDDFDQQVMERYFRNLSKAVEAPTANSLSLKVIYFLDYLTLKKKKPVTEMK